LSIELVEAKAALMRAETERARLERALAEERSTREAALRAAREEATQRVAELERRVERLRELEARVDELEAQALEVVTLRQRNAELEAALATASKRSLAAPDDLKRLRGVGPAFERALRALGITTFAQIAEFTEADIERVAQSLKLKPERIRRDDWVGNARALLAERENG
jgi:predicted flap endonuclease-1-like 5' DNA nuclease